MSEELKIDKRIWKIQEMLGLEKVSNIRYTGVYSTGDFEGTYDYGAGLLTVSITGYPTKNQDVWSLLFTISTIDDGCWQAYDITPTDNRDGVEKRIEELAKAFMEFNPKTALPSEKELNDFLMKFDLRGEFTG